MIRYLLNNIRVFFTFIYLFFEDYTRILYPFVDSIEEKTNLLNLVLFLEKLPENFGEENPEKKEELNLNIENKSNEQNTNKINSESFEIIDTTPLIFSEIEKTIINNQELNENKDNNNAIHDVSINLGEESEHFEENKLDVEIQDDHSIQTSEQEVSKVNEESPNKIIETIIPEDNIPKKEEDVHEKSNISHDNDNEKENNIVQKEEDNIDSTNNINNIQNSENLENPHQITTNDISEIQEDSSSKNKKGRKNKIKIKNKHTFQELEKVSIEKF